MSIDQELERDKKLEEYENLKNRESALSLKRDRLEAGLDALSDYVSYCMEMHLPWLEDAESMQRKHTHFLENTKTIIEFVELDLTFYPQFQNTEN